MSRKKKEKKWNTIMRLGNPAGSGEQAEYVVSDMFEDLGKDNDLEDE